MPVPIFISNIGTTRVENTKIAYEVPNSKANVVCRKDTKHIREPGHKYIMRRFVPGAAFATVYAYPLFGQFNPGLIIIFQHFATQVLVTNLSRPFWIRQMLR